MNKIALLLILISQSISAQLNVPIQKQINGNELFATLNTSLNDFVRLKGFKRHGLSESSFIERDPSLIYNSWFSFSCIDKLTGREFFALSSKEENFGAGPIYNINYTPTKNDKINYKKIWVVLANDIISHKKDFSDNSMIDTKINSIYAWPGNSNPHFMEFNGFELVLNYDYAPFVDVNKDGIYNPDDGDYPHLKNIVETIIPQTIAWRIEHHVNHPFKFELRSSFWQLACEDIAPINRTVFCSMELINRTPFTLSDLKLFMYSDSDLGCYTDDYFGTDSSRNSIYYYNADDNDGEGVTGQCDQNVVTYKKPPVLSLIYLNNKLDASLGLYGVRPYFKQEMLNDIFNPNYLINERTKQSTTYEFSENPNEKGSWSMKEFNYLPMPGSVLSICRLNEFIQDEKIQFDYAYLLTKDQKLNHLEMVSRALDDIDIIKENYSEKFKNICTNKICEKDCVWPGDANNDGIVNYLDAVNIFYGIGISETKRADSIKWNALTSLNWKSNTPNSVNAKYADANGDGIVNLNDLGVITKYYSFQHGVFNQDDKECNSTSNSKFQFKDVILENESKVLQFKIVLNTPEQVFQGISFEIDIDNSEYGNVIFRNHTIWLDNMVRTLNYKENVSEALNHQGEKAVFFNDKQDDQGKNSEINWNIRMSLDTANRKINQPFSVIRICNGKLYMNNGQVIPIASDSLHIPNSRFVSTHNVTTEDISFFPNPANNQIHFTHPELIESIIIYNLQGQLIKTVKTNLIESKLIIEDLNSGMYLLEIKTKDGRLIKKLSVNR